MWMKHFYGNLRKVAFLVAFLSFCPFLLKAQTLTLSTVDAGPYTPGSSIAVPFNINTSSGCINHDNVFKLYISSVPGGTPDTQIGSYTGFYAAFINGTIPTGLAAGSYNLAIKSSDPVVTSATTSINIVAGSAIVAGVSGTRINSDNPEIFGNCSGSSSNYTFINASTSGSTATVNFHNEFSQSDEGTFNLNPSKSFSAAYANYTVLVKATSNGTEGTKAYQLINNKLNTSFGTTGTNTVCLNNGTGQLSYTVDYTSANGIQYNYPGNLYIVDWGDGSPQSIYSLCEIKNLGGVLSHSYTQPSCGNNSGSQINSFQVNAQVSSGICGTLGSPITSYAKVVRPPTNSINVPNSACLNVPITFLNTSDPGQDASSTSTNCTNNNALYTWYIDGTAQVINYTAGASFTYTFTTPGQHTVTLELQSQSGSVCSATDVTKNICVLAKPQPQFTVDNSTICSNGTVTVTDGSVTDNSCSSIPQNNAYTWSVTGPGSTAFINSTTSASHSPQIQFSSPGVYTLTLSIGTESCGAVSTSQTITVNTTPTVTLSPDKQYCGTNQTFTFANNAGDTQTIFTGTTTDQPNTYSWTVTGGNYSYQNGTSASSKYPQIMFTDFAAYTITATQTNNCGTDSKSQHITFLQSPTVNAGPDQTICPADVVQLAGTISNPQPQSYQWTGGNGTFSPGRTSLNATYTPTSAEVDAGQVHLNLVAITGYPSPCDQLSDEVIITINPRNAVTSASSSVICTGTTFSYQPTAQITGSTFTYTSSASGTVTGNTASGSGNISDMLTNSDANNNGTVVYTIAPSSNGCPGTPFTLTVTVTPLPVVIINNASNTICSGQATNIGLSSNLVGTTFMWTSVASNGISGNTNQTAINTTAITDNLYNSSATTTGSVTYTITPIGPGPTNCAGAPVTVTINVLPLPIVANAGPDASICAAANYTLNGNDPGISTGTWTVTSGPGGVTFANAHQYNTVVNGLQAGNIYTFRWTITGAAPCNATFDEVSINNLSPLTNTISVGQPAFCYGQTITINGDQPTGGTGTYVYSWESSADGSTNWTAINGASGPNYSFTGTQSIYVRRIVGSAPCSNVSQPVYVVVQQAINTNTITADQLICYNTTPALLNGSTPGGGDGNYSYQWQSSTDNGANWNTINGATTLNYQPVALSVTTQFRRIVTTALCINAQQSTSNTVTITVNPQNTNTVTSDASRTICTGATLNYHITARDANTSFTWVSSVSGSITGNTASGSGDISDVLTNADLNNNGTVTYTITPINNNCPGVPFTLTVTVTPLPIITVNNTSNTICSGQPVGITFTSNLVGTTFRWTSTASTGISGNNNQPTAISATGITDVLYNSSAMATGTVTYQITPVSASGCTGSPVTVTIIVQPLPVVANAGQDDAICATTTYTLNGNNPGISSGNWSVVSGQTGVSFTNAAQYNTTVNGLQPGQLYTFLWTITGASQCAVTSDDVNVNDLLDLTNNISFGSPTVCYGQTITITGDQPTGGTNSFVYSWQSSTDNSTWTTINGQNGLNYSFTATQNIYLRRVVTSGPCTKISQPVYLIVQPPIANNSITADQLICYNTAPTSLTGSAPTGADGNYFYQWQSSSDNGATWLTISGATAINYQPVTLLGTTQFRRIVTTALCNNGQGNNSNIITITVNPQNTNQVTSDASRMICTGTTLSYHITAQQPNTVFTWVSSASGTVTGNTASGSGDISDALTNSDPNNNGTVTYTITPFNNNCPGVPFTLTVTVTPRPIITVNSTTNTICSGQPTGITFTANLTGTVFKWTSTASAGIFGNNNQQPVFASRIDDVLTSNITTAGTATYTITPIGPSGCEGTPVTVTITVQPQPIQANAGNDEQICAAGNFLLKGNNPAPFTGTWTVTSGQTGLVFANANQYNTTVSGLQAGQQYTFRWTISGNNLCASTADDVVITDLQDLTNTIGFANPAVCFGQTATILGAQPVGGTGSYLYSWQSSSDGNTWNTIAGQTGQNLAVTLTASTYFRRIVTSGPCVNTSNSVQVVVQPQLAANSITANQLICYNTTPTVLTGSTPTGGDGSYNYQWQSSADNGANWLSIPSANGINYQPVSLTTTTQFRRIVSTALCNGAQQNNSNVVTITVTPRNTNTLNSASALTICTGTSLNYQPTAVQGNTSFTWVSSASASITGNSASGTGAIHDALVNNDPVNNGTVSYTITPINNNCPGVPFTLTVTVTPIPQIIITNSGKQICSGNPTGITFNANIPGTFIKWTFDPVAGIQGMNNQFPVIATRIDDILTSSLTTPATVVYHLTPISANGCVGPTVDATVTVLPQPVTAKAGADDAICNSPVYTLNGNDPSPSTGKWTLTSGQTGVGFADATRYNTAVSGLVAGQQYTFRWTITSTGACSTSTDDVVITNLVNLSNNISFPAPAVCYGQTISVTGDQPTGGNGNYVYSWESSTDNANWTTIRGASSINYTFTATSSIYFRRTVTSGPCSSISQPVYIIVQQPITANTIGSSQEVCYNNTPKLFAGSTPAGADGKYFYQWQSSTDNGANWANIPSANGINYQINSLTVTTQFRRVVTSVLCNGPQQSISNVITVMVNPLVDPTYTFTGDLGCIPYKLDATNIKAKAAPGNATYTWFADGVQFGSGLTFPGYTITQDNQQVVIKLLVTSKFGCPDASFSHTFTTIKEVSASFSQDQTKGCGPLTVTFNNTSNPKDQATYTWNFGNGQTSTLINPTPITYQPRTDGKDTTFVITLKALTACGIRTFTSTVLVRPKPISIFTPDRTIGCSPFTVNFNNTSPGINNTYTFDFGDGQTLVTHDNQSVIHTYVSTTSKTFVVKMTAQNECGISVTQYNIRISPNSVLPQLVVNGDQKAGCAPWTVQFYNNTKGGTYFTYDFGDGTTQSSQSAPEVVTHTFLKSGTFNVKLSATNGCSDTATYQQILVYPQPAANFTSDVQNGCTQLTVNFKNTTPGTGNSYVWDFGDGGTAVVANPQHTFTARNTPFTITLIAKNSLGCTDTMVMKNYINVTIPPKAVFMAKPDSVIVYPYYSFSFADNSTNNPIIWKWSFGDGFGASKENPDHTYRDTGSYKVSLVVYNLQGCADSVTHTVRITGTPGQLFVPNAFMPTSKFNEVVTFKAKGSGIKTWRMRVFNKWGQVVWETTKLTERGEPAEGWDGMMNGQPAPQGVYVWQIEATYINGNEWKGMSYNHGSPIKSGVIHLIK